MMKPVITFNNIKLYLVLLLVLCTTLGVYLLVWSNRPAELDVAQISRNAVKEYAQIFQLDEKKFTLINTEFMENTNVWFVNYDSPYPDSNKLFVIIKADGTYEISMRPIKKYDPPN